MGSEFAYVAAGLRENNILPAAADCVFVSGSLVRGWGTATSDLDVTVVTTAPWVSRSGDSSPVALHPDAVQNEQIFVAGRRWDVAYWLDAQLDQLLEKLSWQRLDAGAGPWRTLGPHEISLLERLPYAVPVEGAAWFAELQERLRRSAHRAVLVSNDLHHADGYTEDVTGLMAAGDVEAAVLAARLAFGHALDALLASLGQFGSKWPKWRAKRFRLAAPSLLSFDEYWAVETMSDYDEKNPEKWIEGVLTLCQKISMEIEL